ncbi:unannotated protein [freshwater metagenome]|uniref:Unannotated protein n=1 Tax=freshwater metagenome TaxID=449393 RepID=A0A6J7K6X7_9ZZZZ|nr:hypothetical protein [Actinomycetota bacterium]
MSPPEPPPEFFVDRSLGRKRVPAALRAEGLVLRTMAEEYGERVGQGLADTEWLRDAGENGWIVLSKDDRIRRRPAEIAAVREHAIRMFCLTNANLTGTQQAQRFVTNIDAMMRQARVAGPWIYGVYDSGIRPLVPPPKH